MIVEPFTCHGKLKNKDLLKTKQFSFPCLAEYTSNPVISQILLKICSQFITQVQGKGLCCEVGVFCLGFWGGWVCLFVCFINSVAAALPQKFQPQKYGTEYWENLI